MPIVSVKFNNTLNQIKSKTGLEINFSYPCLKSNECLPYYVTLPKGSYKFELYGASGGSGSTSGATTQRYDNRSCLSQEIVQFYGGNTICNPRNSPGAGAFIGGYIFIEKTTLFYLHIGGKGEFRKLQSSENVIENRPKGGYNGGGDGIGHLAGSSGGGGATDIRVLSDDYWHRIIVAGGGGGIDDYDSLQSDNNDGSGGSGGYPNGQGCFLNGYEQHSAGGNQSSGFSFFHGQSASTGATSSDLAGSGGGWYGGSFCHSSNAGGSGGSSWILTNDAFIPQGTIDVYNSTGELFNSEQYAFSHSSPYIFHHMIYANGIWNGDGFARITVLSSEGTYCVKSVTGSRHFFFFVCFLT